MEVSPHHRPEVMTVRPVGVVRSPVRERGAMPPFGVPAVIEFFPEYQAGLLRLEKHSHIWVVAWLDRSERDLLQVTPRGVSASDPAALHGVFAVRSPARPNPLGLTAARIHAIRASSVEVESLDFLDGTAVVDIKPYFVSRDLIYSATNAQIGRPSSREALRESLLHQARAFHAELCADLALAVRIVEHFRAEVLRFQDDDTVRIAVPVERGCLIDAVMGMTRVSPGRGTLLLHRRRRLCFFRGESVFEYEPLARRHDPAAILEVPDEVLFRARR